MLRFIFCLLVFVGIACRPVVGQQVPPEPSKPLAPIADAKLHTSVLSLLELSGTRKRLLEAQIKVMPQAKAALIQSAPGITSEFADEWAKRMVDETSIDEYVNAIASVYEKHFSIEDIDQLIVIQKDVNDNKPPTISDTLKAKISENAIAFQSEIMGACTQIGSRRGAEIAQAIGKEHPDWVKAPGASTASPEEK